jgi:hypothetical protein
MTELNGVIGGYPYVNCPNCDLLIEIDALNCCIFRCGIYKQTYTQIPPHSTREECDRLLNTNQIYGCSKPFIIRQVVNPLTPDGHTYIAEKCDYI